MSNDRAIKLIATQFVLSGAACCLEIHDSRTGEEFPVIATLEIFLDRSVRKLLREPLNFHYFLLWNWMMQPSNPWLYYNSFQECEHLDTEHE